MTVRTVTVYGGQSINLQLQALKHGANIVVATPGRLIDHVKRGTIRLDNVKFMVLDEADKMFDMGFMKDIKPVLKISNLYINSSYFEGFPNSVIEAINFGLPIISSQSYGGINEILLNGKCGTIFKNGDSVDLANKIQNFYNNPKKFSLKTKLAKRNIQRFTLKKNISNYENLFYNL